MKKITFTPNVLLTLVLLTFSITTLRGQTAPAGPSDATKNPPTNASDVKQVLCATSVIKLKISATSDAAYKTYKWFKVTGATTTMVKDGADNSYTETPAGPGYYSYRLIVTNNNDCTSEESDLFEVYVLPVLAPTISASKAEICEKEQSSSTLTVDGLDARFQYNYQWTRNSTPIAGAANASYEVKEAAPGNVTYGVNVSYKLNSSCTGSDDEQIRVIAIPSKPVIEIGN
ncbi:hypothetical protein [Arcticibacter sp. MXS-1]|uniref:hypothetical protein n=1 Tax=Arcticibacter sp. MXS-1 TaxID=3341726 RepID=UPI0035A9251D